MMASRRSWLALLAATVLTLGAGTAPAAAQNRDVLVFAAASLKNALDEVDAQWQTRDRQEGRDLLRGELDAGQADRAGRAGRHLHLRRSRLDGLPRQQKDLIKPDTRSNLLGNRLVLIAPKDSKTQRRISSPASTSPSAARRRPAGDGQRRRGAGRQVRQGGAARSSASGTASRTRSRRPRTCAPRWLLVARGEAPLGIVYQTDAAAEPNVKIVGTFPEDTHPPIIYPIALTPGADQSRRGGVPDLPASPAARPLFERRASRCWPSGQS